ncbi:AAA family ATPase [Kribbella sp. NPDC051586]|uniref:helix-turn-helix transcriptional regulator n=1 Tax=Kribbella sp. NPDC051586 TaxID=3364118 RepID=UPI0037B4AE25
MLYGRDGERMVIDHLLDRARRGRSGALVLRGEAGIGKTVLLDYAATAWGGPTVLRGAAVQSESALPYAGLHLLLRHQLHRLDALPDRQATVLRAALGQGVAAGSDQFLVGLAVLTLLADLAEEHPLLLLIDDAQWLDRASRNALLFAVRRLHADAVAVLIAVRDEGTDVVAPGLEELRLGGLEPDAARALVAEQGTLAAVVAERIVEEADGNPLALIELPATMTPDQRAGRSSPFLIPADLERLGGSVIRAFQVQVQRMPPPTRALLLAAAADDTGRMDVVLAAAQALGAGPADLDPAEHAGLVDLVDGEISFRHPLVRTAAYRNASRAQRITVHQALAEGFAGVEQARRAWHLAAAGTGPDEAVAGELEQAAADARRHGDLLAVVAAMKRAAQLTPDEDERARRLALAAQAASEAGDQDEAARLAAQAGLRRAEPVVSVPLARVRAAELFVRGEPRSAYDVLVGQAEDVAGADLDSAVYLLFDALTAIWATGDVRATEETAQRLVALPEPPAESARLLRSAASGLLGLSAGGGRSEVSPLRDLYDGLHQRGHLIGLPERARITGWDMLAGDLEAALDLATDLEKECRDQGAIAALPQVLARLARSQLLLGQHRSAWNSGEDGLQISRDTGQLEHVGHLSGVLAYLAAIEGNDDRCRSLSGDALACGSGPSAAWGECALTQLDLGHARYEAALARMEKLGMGPRRHTMIVLYCQPDQVEAAVRLGQPERARGPMERFESWAAQVRQPWSDAIMSRCRALLSEGDQAAEHYATAVFLHAQDPQRPFEAARTEFLFGCWLRRVKRPASARGQLRSALETFERLGALHWADRARAELRAAGETVLPADGDSDLLSRLTPQELQVVRLAATGLSNRVIGAQLFISPRTVGYHLYNAYPKLGITVRAELAQMVLPDG